jgi:hypothetical protein
MSDRQLKLRALSEQAPGWLVAVWNEPVVNDQDDLFIFPTDDGVDQKKLERRRSAVAGLMHGPAMAK